MGGNRDREKDPVETSRPVLLVGSCWFLLSYHPLVDVFIGEVLPLKAVSLPQVWEFTFPESSGPSGGSEVSSEPRRPQALSGTFSPMFWQDPGLPEVLLLALRTQGF